MIHPAPELTPFEQARYEWQMWSPGFGEEGQRKLKAATVAISRCGGIGGVCALQLAAAGVGRLVIAHAGKVKPSDLNRQILQTEAHLGTDRLESIGERLRALNSGVELVLIPENASVDNARRILAGADIVIDAAPLFQERLALNDAAFALGIPMVEAAMYDWEFQLTTFLPRRTGCLRCRCPEVPDYWRRQFPVFGAVSSAVASLAVGEAIKVLTGVGEPLYNKLLSFEMRSMNSRIFPLRRDPHCPVCSGFCVK